MMFNSSTFKKSALQQLKKNIASPLLVSFTVLTVVALIIGPNVSRRAYARISLPPLVLLLVVGTMTMAMASFCIKIATLQRKVTYFDFIEGFSGFTKGFLGSLWMFLWISIWLCFFVVPGIIKAFAYSQMFFIMADHPDMGPIKAMNLSKIMTRDHKMDLFLMALSFVGWLLLSSCTGGILLIWVIPYMSMAYTNAYYYLKEEAFRTGKLTSADFA